MNKNLFFLLIIAILFSFSCKKEELYSFNRPYYSTSFITNAYYELRTAALKDTLYVKDGEGQLNAYFATIKGEFTHLQDSIVQYGHVWSTSNTNPKINPKDTSTFSRYYKNWPIDSLGTFTSLLILYPETPFWVRSYVITAKGDTGYNQQVFCDTTWPPINEWFNNGYMPDGKFREGTVAFTFKHPGRDRTVGLMGSGNNASQAFGDFFIYDPEATIKWEQLGGILPVPRTEAVGFSLTVTDSYGRKNTYLYVGGGCDLEGNVYSTFYKYSFTSNSWQPIPDFPRGIKSGVAFTIDGKAYVGLGTTQHSDKGDFYVFDPELNEAHENPWIPAPGLGDNPVLYARRDAVAFSIDGVGYVGTGMHIDESDDTTYYNDLWKFYPKNVINQSIWGPCSDMPTSDGRGAAVGFAADNQGYIGLGEDQYRYLKDLYRYDPYTDNWHVIADYKMGPDYTGQHTKTKNAFGFGIKKKAYVGTGKQCDDCSEPYSTEFWIYRPW